MSQLLPENVAEMIEKRLCGAISQKQLSDWAWEAHWKDETEQSPYDEQSREAIGDVISALAQSDTAGFELEENELRELLQKLMEQTSKRSFKCMTLRQEGTHYDS